MINKYMPMIVKINIKNKNNKTKTLKLLYSFYYYNNVIILKIFLNYSIRFLLYILCYVNIS